MNKLLENKLRKLIQKEIKNTLSERTIEVTSNDLAKIKGPMQKLILQYTAATKGGKLDVAEIDDAIEAITHWRMYSNKKDQVKENELKSRHKNRFAGHIKQAKSILSALDTWMEKHDISDEDEETDEAVSWLQLNHPELDTNIKNYIIQNNKYNISDDDY